MSISVFDLYTIGIGPSSSHSVGPMRAANQFVAELEEKGDLEKTDRVKVVLYGSLALTGVGHGTDKAVLMGLCGEQPESVDPDSVDGRSQQIKQQKRLLLGQRHEIEFCYDSDLIFDRKKQLPEHPNGMEIFAYRENKIIYNDTYFSVGGGFVVTQSQTDSGNIPQRDHRVKYPFSTAAGLLEICQQNQMSISQVTLENEKTWATEIEIEHKLWHIWEVMQQSVDSGCEKEGILPGGLKVKRRAASLSRSLSSRPEYALRDPLNVIDWVDLYALAVNEENAAGGRVVTAPTNGAAGVIPAVLHYYDRFVPTSSRSGVLKFLLTAGAIAMLYKINASISGAEVGCQGEVGVACSMAAGALTEVMGGTPLQVEQAAEIGMEHNLGLTCDPIGGLVQVPCIERNAMAAVKAINASRLARRGDGMHHVTLDKVIATMRRTGKDMHSKYKETSRGGLAVNFPEC